MTYVTASMHRAAWCCVVRCGGRSADSTHHLTAQHNTAHPCRTGSSQNLARPLLPHMDNHSTRCYSPVFGIITTTEQEQRQKHAPGCFVHVVLPKKNNTLRRRSSTRFCLWRVMYLGQRTKRLTSRFGGRSFPTEKFFGRDTSRGFLSDSCLVCFFTAVLAFGIVYFFL